MRVDIGVELRPFFFKAGRRVRTWQLMAPLAALIALFLCTPARAQYRFDHWTSDNGLPQNSVRDVLQTRDGYLWFTTFDGLVRFDGVHFTVFNKSNSPDLPGNRFLGLFEDRSGDLWATLEDGKVVQRHRGRFAVERVARTIVLSIRDNGRGFAVGQRRGGGVSDADLDGDMLVGYSYSVPSQSGASYTWSVSSGG